MIVTTHPRCIAAMIQPTPTQEQIRQGLEIAQGLRAFHQISTDPTRTLDCPQQTKPLIMLDLGARPIASDLCSRVGQVAQKSLQQYHDAFSLLEMLRIVRPTVFSDSRVHYQTNYQFLREIFGQPSALNESRDFVSTTQALHYADLIFLP